MQICMTTQIHIYAHMYTYIRASGYHEVLILPSEDYVPLSLQTVDLQELRNIKGLS